MVRGVIEKKMYISIITIPIITIIITSIFSRRLGKEGQEQIIKKIMIIMNIIGLGILSEVILNKTIIKINIYKWIEINDITSTIQIIFNKNSVLMINLVLIVSTIVIYFSYWYMNGDPHIYRFITYILSFTMFMLLFILSNNIILTFLS